jgi:hypothetical protein
VEILPRLSYKMIASVVLCKIVAVMITYSFHNLAKHSPQIHRPYFLANDSREPVKLLRSWLVLGSWGWNLCGSQ